MRENLWQNIRRADRIRRAHAMTGGSTTRAALVIALVAAAVWPYFVPTKLDASEAGKASDSAGAAIPTGGTQTESQASGPISPQPAGTVFKLNVPTTSVDSGTSFQVPITLTSATNVFSFAIIFDYDPTLMKLASISPGDFLDRDGKTAPVVDSDSPVGHVVISMSRPPGSPGLDGDGTLCVLNFDAANAGTGQLKIERAFVVDNVHNVIPMRVAQSRIVVR